MERKKLFRSVWFWIAIVVVLGFLGSSFFRSDGGYSEVSTSIAIAQIEDGNVRSATLNTREQTVDLDLRSRGAASVSVLALLRKPDAAKVAVDVRYVGFDIPNAFVVGYGLDYAERYRNLPFVGTLARHVYADATS